MTLCTFVLNKGKKSDMRPQFSRVCTPAPSTAWGIQNFRKVFAGGEGITNFFFGGGGLILLGGSSNFEVKIKLHNTSINSIFGITNLIYFRDI